MADRVAELTVVRHGQSTANVALAAAEAAGAAECDVAGPDAEVELTPLGVRQAVALGRWLVHLPAGRRPEVVVVSPFRRARLTWRHAAGTAAAHGVDLPGADTDARLVDRLMGPLELLPSAAVTTRFPAEAARQLSDGEFLYRPPGGESYGDIAVRLAEFLADLDTRCAGRRVLVVAHDIVVLMMRYVIERLDFDDLAEIMRAGAVANASVTRFVAAPDGLRLAGWNRVDHLAGPAER